MPSATGPSTTTWPPRITNRPSPDPTLVLVATNDPSGWTVHTQLTSRPSTVSPDPSQRPARILRSVGWRDRTGGSGTLAAHAARSSAGRMRANVVIFMVFLL